MMFRPAHLVSTGPAAPSVRRRVRPPVLLLLACVVLACAATVCLTFAGGMIHANVVAEPAGPGELYLGDGTGYVLGVIAAVPGSLFLVGAVAPPLLWRRGKRDAALIVAAVIGALFLALLMAWAQIWL